MRGILFDLGGTLLRQATYQPELGLRAVLDCCETAGEHSLEEMLRFGEQLSEVIAGQRRVLQELLAEMRFAAVLRLFLDRFDLRSVRTLEELELEFWTAGSRMTPLEDVVPALEKFHAADVRMGVLSNSMFGAGVLEWELARHGLRRYFPVILSSADYGLRKPFPGLFTLAAFRLGEPPGELWYLGDNWRNDVAGSRSAGLRPIWISGRSQPTGEAVTQIRCWKELPDIVLGTMSG